MMNLFDSLNCARRVMESSGAVLEHSRRWPRRYAIRTSKPARPVEGMIEITVRTRGLRHRFYAARISGCMVYWEDK